MRTLYYFFNASGDGAAQAARTAHTVKPQTLFIFRRAV
jgi:hypothetical protein